MTAGIGRNAPGMLAVMGAGSNANRRISAGNESLCSCRLRLWRATTLPRCGQTRATSCATWTRAVLAPAAPAVEEAPQRRWAFARDSSSEKRPCWTAAGNGRSTPELKSVTRVGPYTNPRMSR